MRAASKNRKEYDVEIGQGTFQEMRQLQGEIDVIKDRLLVAQGESLGRVVRDRLGSGGYGNDLGVVHKAQKDLERLSDGLRSRSGSKQFPRGDPRIVFLLTILISVHQRRSWERLRLCSCWSRRTSSLW